MGDPQFGDIFDRHYPISRLGESEQRREQSRLTAAARTGNEKILARGNGITHRVRADVRKKPATFKFVQCNRVNAG